MDGGALGVAPVLEVVGEFADTGFLLQTSALLDVIKDGVNSGLVFFHDCQVGAHPLVRDTALGHGLRGSGLQLQRPRANLVDDALGLVLTGGLHQLRAAVGTSDDPIGVFGFARQAELHGTYRRTWRSRNAQTRSISSSVVAALRHPWPSPS